MNGAEAFQKKKYVVAKHWYSEALEVAPTDATLLSNRSACYARMHNGTEALTDATECISLRPDWPKAYYRAGLALNILKVRVFSSALLFRFFRKPVAKGTIKSVPSRDTLDFDSNNIVTL
ncbi:hypothetical protein MKW98_029661 [Papaver atlanticum]|uniref:Uncharacterized protein n=1 Tax=Papaver atlanticum TaxID=357466 RepID=A0AAD4T3S0_9MAGN|nr:hypothetical protein MKW98_029661 [Papaver atlanticum]